MVFTGTKSTSFSFKTTPYASLFQKRSELERAKRRTESASAFRLLSENKTMNNFFAKKAFREACNRRILSAWCAWMSDTCELREMSGSWERLATNDQENISVASVNNNEWLEEYYEYRALISSEIFSSRVRENEWNCETLATRVLNTFRHYWKLMRIFRHKKTSKLQYQPKINLRIFSVDASAET